MPNSNPGVTGAPAGGSASSQPSTQQYGPSSNTGGAPDSKSLAAPSAPSAQGSPGSSVSLYAPLYYSSPYLMPISWGIFFGALIWRGRLRSAWCKQGYDYDTFKLVARMKGSPLRVKLLQLVDTPKNRLQLANELQVDWRTIDNHIQALARNSLVEETVSVGTTKYYRLTEHGRRILALLTENEQDVFRSVDPVSESS